MFCQSVINETGALLCTTRECDERVRFTDPKPNVNERESGIKVPFATYLGFSLTILYICVKTATLSGIANLPLESHWKPRAIRKESQNVPVY